MRTTAPLPVCTHIVMIILLFSGGCRADVGTPCTDTANCITGEVCDTVSSSCVCDTSTHYQDGTSCLERLNPGVSCSVSPTNACKDNSMCKNNVCTCNNGYYDSDGPSANNGICTPRLNPGEACSSLPPNACKDNSQCTGGVCICINGYYDSDGPSVNSGTCTARLNPGVTCDAAIPNACKVNSDCTEGSCSCNNGYYDNDGLSNNNGICAALIALSGTCTSGLGVTQCQTTGAVCATDNRCRCNQGTFDSNGFGTADGTCVGMDNLKATSLDSSNVGTTSVTISWSAPATNSGQVSRYDVVWSEAGGGTRTGATATSVQVTGLQSATTYYFYIKSIESGSWTADQEVSSTNPISVTTKSLLGGTCTVGNCADSNAVCSNNKCVCGSGYYDNDGDTTNVGGTCTVRLNPGVSCLTLPSNACKDNSVCINGVCTCNSDYYDSDGSASGNDGICIPRLNPGVSCTSLPGDACKDNSMCINGVCTCNSDYYDSDGSASGNGGICIPRLNPGVSCAALPGDACKDNSMCTNNVCTCDNGYYDSDGSASGNGGICIPRLNPGVSCATLPSDACKDNSMCINRVCTCNSDYYDSDGPAPANGGACVARLNPGVSCLTLPGDACKYNSMCINGVCTCNNGYYDSDGPSANSGMCVAGLNPGEACSSLPSNACKDNSMCTGGVCTCNNGYYDSDGPSVINGICTPRLNPGVTCDAAIPNVCKDNSACTEGSCSCNPGYYDSDGLSNNNGVCAALIVLSGTCTSGLGVTQCQTTGADCATDNRCRCSQGTFDSNGFGTADGTCVGISNLMATPLASSNLGSTSVTINWSAPATYSGQVSRYDVVWTGAGGGTRTGTTATSLQVTGLQSATTYNFYIKSIESGSWTADQEVTTSTPITVTTKSLLGDTCTVGSCADQNADCSTTCVCKSGFFDNDGDTSNVGGTCTARLNPGVSCPVSPTNACKDNSVCTGGVCTCNNGYYDSDGPSAYNGICTPRLNPGVSCPVSPTNACKDNSICTNGFCTCNNGYYDSDGPSLNNGICTTMSLPPETLVVTQILSRQFTLIWTVPTLTNGALRGYRLTVLDGSTCVHEVLFTCTSCSGYFQFSYASSCEARDRKLVTIQFADLASYTYTVDTLNPHTNYTVSVLAVNNAGEGLPNTTYVITDQEVPEPPSLLICKAATDQTITLAWSAPSQSSGPRIQYYVVNSITTGATFSTTSNLTEYTVDHGLQSATIYIFSVASVNDVVTATNQRTYSSQIGCTTKPTTPECETSCGTDSLFIPSIVLIVIAIITLLITVGLEIAFRRNKLCCSTGESSKQKRYQNVQLSERGNNGENYSTPASENESSQYQILDGNEVAKASVYSEIGGHPRVAVYQNDPSNDRDSRTYESLQGRSNPNFYDELKSGQFDNKGTYKNINPSQQYR